MPLRGKCRKNRTAAANHPACCHRIPSSRRSKLRRTIAFHEAVASIRVQSRFAALADCSSCHRHSPVGHNSLRFGPMPKVQNIIATQVDHRRLVHQLRQQRHSLRHKLRESPHGIPPSFERKRSCGGLRTPNEKIGSKFFIMGHRLAAGAILLFCFIKEFKEGGISRKKSQYADAIALLALTSQPKSKRAGLIQSRRWK